jgi:transcriptional regulator with GAF, ATPase, and Fis domain
MLEIPSRQDLAALAEATNRVIDHRILGFVRAVDETRASVFSAYPNGIAEYIMPMAQLPDVLSPGDDGARQIDAASFYGNKSDAIQWLLKLGSVQRVVSLPVPRHDSGARFWLGLQDPRALTNDQLSRLASAAHTSADVLRTTVSQNEAPERLRRVELAAELLPALLSVLDVREVFNRLSSIAQHALPHDLLLLRVFIEDLSKVLTFARTGGGADLDIVVPATYPPAVMQVWNFDIMDDHAFSPIERNNTPAKMGVRASLRFPIRFDDRVIGGLVFMSFEPKKYGADDVLVGRRLADHVALALSHHNLAERLAEQARSAEALRARTTNLELLDELLAALTDSGDMREVFGRISAIAGKVLAHDALVLMVRSPDGRNSRAYASSGFPIALPEVTGVPEELVQNPDWEYDILDDISQLEDPELVHLGRVGFRALLRVPIRLDGHLAGTLIFLSNTLAGFKQPDVQVARRMADRLAVKLARDREIEVSRRAAEATERAARLEARVRTLTEELDSRTGYRRVVGKSQQWLQVLTQATQVAATETTVLLLGESGTGKEVVARFVHRASKRNGGPFVALNCAALPEHLLEAELFGYERGAFTGAMQTKPGQLEQAAGGTLFLDEVAEMSPSSQAKLLRVLEEREFQRLGGTRVLRTDVRVVAATNRDLQRAIAHAHFREDLYYRLNVFAIRLPALREHRDDILPLSEAFIADIGRSIGRPPAGISRDARQMLIEYHWPGNVRELRNILERAAILCDGGLITADHLALHVLAPVATAPLKSTAVAATVPAPPPPAASVPSQRAQWSSSSQPRSAADLHSLERTMIEQALQAARFNKSKAAKALGLTRHQLYIRMKKHGFE